MDHQEGWTQIGSGRSSPLRGVLASLERHPSPPAKKKPAVAGFFVWLGERDSNPRWRSQSPQSYH